MLHRPVLVLLLASLLACGPKPAPEPAAAPDPNEVAAAGRSQTPAAPLPYPTRELTVTAADGVVLAGTLALPVGEGPFPAVLLLTGSGAQDRDETLAGHKPFLVWSDHLARNGIASLRLDDRGVGGSGGVLSSTPSTTLKLDALAALEVLGAQPEVAGDRLGLVGHSEGATIAGLTAGEAELAGVVLLAPPATNGRQILLDQAEAILRAGGASSGALAKHREAHAKALDALDTDQEEAAFWEFVRVQVDLAVELGAPRPPDLQPIVDGALGMVRTVSFRSLLAQEPTRNLERVEEPILAVGGSLDLQVLPSNLDTLRRALDAHPDATVLEFPGLNHLFQHAGRGTPEEYGLIDETVAPEVLDAVTAWLTQRL